MGPDRAPSGDGSGMTQPSRHRVDSSVASVPQHPDHLDPDSALSALTAAVTALAQENRDLAIAVQLMGQEIQGRDAGAPEYLRAEKLAERYDVSAEWIRDNGVHLGATPLSPPEPGRKPRLRYQVAVADAFMEQMRDAYEDGKRQPRRPRQRARRGSNRNNTIRFTPALVP